MADLSEPIDHHVPAWKKLGLKLKTARSEPQLPNADPDVAALKRKRQSKITDPVVGDNSVERTAKRSKTSDPQLTKPPNINGTTPIVSHENEKNLIPSTASKSLSKRKSVSFTPGTKTKDGESTKDLYNTWVASEKESDPSFDPKSFDGALRSPPPPSVRLSREAPPPLQKSKSKKRKKKKKNKSKSTQISSTSTSQDRSSTARVEVVDPNNTESATHPALTYLETYHSSPSTWKFSKARQSYILKHLFSLSHIPPSYNASLRKYLSGLQSSSACERLRSEALKIQTEDEEWLDNLPASPPDIQSATTKNDTPTHNQSISTKDKKANMLDTKTYHREAFARAVGHHESLLLAIEDAKTDIEKDKLWIEKVQRRRRAEIVLWGIGGQLANSVNAPNHTANNHNSGTRTNNAMEATRTQQQRQKRDLPAAAAAAAGQPITPNNNNKKRKRKRKQKRRTGVPDDDDDSSSSSSSSNSDSEKEDGRKKKKVQINGAFLRGKTRYNDEVAAVGKGRGGDVVDLTETTSGSDSESSDSDSDSDTSTTSGSDSDSDSGDSKSTEFSSDSQ
ncbi:MAG: hypothetical protein Q9190_007667 [Brigantiaea leucoxantha]